MNGKLYACDIVDYWKCLEFFKQDSYKEGVTKPSKKQQQSKSCYYHIIEEGDLLQCLQSEMAKHDMACWGNIVIYLGKISRDICTEKLAELARYDGVLPENSASHIAWATLQLNSDGSYIRGSFSLSPVLWAIRQMINGNELDIQCYKEDVYAIDSLLLKYINEDNMLDEAGVFALCAMPIQQLRELLGDIYETYVAHLNVNELAQEDKDKILVNFTAYDSIENQQKYDKRQFSNLYTDFFISDMEWVVSQLSQKQLHPMTEALVKYITSPSLSYDIARQEVINVKQSDTYQYAQWLVETLNVKQTPLGMWPSPYRPALMQQVAINMTTNNTSTIFSVNGPPGTGKTTLLKDIIANNIVERAQQLVQYNFADDLFVPQEFEQGKDGNKYYDADYQYFYEMEDSRINDYSMMVVSSNNNAVENITKELPIKDESLDILKGNDDIYFSHLAKKLLNNQEQEVLGLLSAPLGKRANINHFNKSVLMPLINKMKKNTLKEAHQQYKVAKKNFLQQLKITQQLQQQLATYSDKNSQYYLGKYELTRQYQRYYDLKEQLTEKVEALTTKIKPLHQQKDILSIDKATLSEKLNQQQQKLTITNEEIKKYEADILRHRENIVNARSNMGWMDKLFNTKKKIEINNLIASYQQSLDDLQQPHQQKLEYQIGLTHIIADLCEQQVQLHNKLDKIQQQIDEAEQYKYQQRQVLLDSQQQYKKLQHALQSLARDIADMTSMIGSVYILMTN